MSPELFYKVLKIAAEICYLHGEVAGSRICQDWSGKTIVLDELTSMERDELMMQYEAWNSQGEEFEPGYFPYDEMLISYAISRALTVLSEQSQQASL